MLTGPQSGLFSSVFTILGDQTGMFPICPGSKVIEMVCVSIVSQFTVYQNCVS